MKRTSIRELDIKDNSSYVYINFLNKNFIFNRISLTFH